MSCFGNKSSLEEYPSCYPWHPHVCSLHSITTNKTHSTNQPNNEKYEAEQSMSPTLSQSRTPSHNNQNISTKTTS